MEQNIIKTVIDDLVKKRNNISLQFKQIEEAIRALQNVCEHEFAYKQECEDFMRNPINKICIYCDLEQKV